MWILEKRRGPSRRVLSSGSLEVACIPLAEAGSHITAVHLTGVRNENSHEIR